MKKIIDFIKYLAGSSKVEINNLKTVTNFKDSVGKTNIYFTAGLGEKLDRRCNDDDIKTKKYFIVDLDIRLDYYKKHNKILTQEELDKEIDLVLKLLKKNSFGDYSYSVKSGNGLHLYYTGKERAFDKYIYSSGVSWIYNQIDDVLKNTPYRCDHSISNISRIIRLPGTINPRKKIQKDKTLWDFGDYECNIYEEQPQDCLLFELIEDFAKEFEKEKEQEKQDQIEIKKIVKDFRKSDDIREEINHISAGELAEIVRGVRVSDKGLENVALRESKKNMGAYRYKPYNIIVNTGSSLIKTDKKTFTPFELVLYEMFDGDKKKTVEFFKDKYGIEVKSDNKKSKETKIEIPKMKYETIGYIYPNEVFDPFDCILSGELVTIVAESNAGKTTFAMDIIEANSKLGKRGFYINCEFAIDIMWKGRWLYMNRKKKRNLSDLDPLTEQEQIAMDNYVQKKLKQFDYHNQPNGIELQELVDLILQKKSEGYNLFVLDTFSRIKGNLESDIARTSQNKAMETLQELCQNTGIVLILLHHTNRKGTFEGSQKIMDLSNVFIMMTKDTDGNGEDYRIFSLSKDKFVSRIDLDVYYRNQQYFKS
ncbi:MAG TPA: AAA family ATPase [Candidatus Absconditabacterales bacterium]|nr:AAA family ATPase [Candidatus Absconditabacterales bacterium]HRU50146.1 AAA family ATPase [Candidatus Absconditabacterales bacterium]